MRADGLAFVLAFLAGMLVAFFWYQKGPIADAWERVTGVTPDRSRPARTRNMTRLALANGLTAAGLLAAIHMVARASHQEDSLQPALVTGAVAWLVFSATTLLQHNAFELKPDRLTAINLGYQLVLFLTMSLVIGLL